MSDSIIHRFESILSQKRDSVILVVVSKRRTVEEVMPVYLRGQRIFAENQVQELLKKREALPQDIHWHMIGKLQTNKVKYIAPFISCIQSVDTLKLLDEIDKRARNCDRIIDVLLQVRIAKEISKAAGVLPDEFSKLFAAAAYDCKNISLRGLMGMATHTKDQSILKSEFTFLSSLFFEYKEKFQSPYFATLSMGMTHDYPLAMQCGSNMIRIGSGIFG